MKYHYYESIAASKLAVQYQSEKCERPLIRVSALSYTANVSLITSEFAHITLGSVSMPIDVSLQRTWAGCRLVLHCIPCITGKLLKHASCAYGLYLLHGRDERIKQLA